MQASPEIGLRARSVAMTSWIGCAIPLFRTQILAAVDGVMPIDLEIPSACDFSMREFEPAFLSQHVSTCLSVSQRVSPLPRRLVPVEYWKPARVKSWAVPGVVGVKVAWLQALSRSCYIIFIIVIYLYSIFVRNFV